jgi:glycosyltransferase involved in cell wall biosynthesis
MAAEADKSAIGSITRRAAEAFSRGEYAESLALYENLSVTLSDSAFQANILLCQRRLATGTTPLQTLFRAAARATKFAETRAAIRDLEKLLGEDASPEAEANTDRLKASPAFLLTLLRHITPRRTKGEGSGPRRICYVLHNSLPFSSGGYATRSHGLASGLAQTGREVVCLTRPGYPLDIAPELARADLPACDEIDGVRYVRLRNVAAPGGSAVDNALAAADAIEKGLKDANAEAVVAASNNSTALPALIAARRLGIPFVYEVRGFWEISRSSREPQFENSPEYFVQILLETAVSLEADHVCTLTQPMREELVARGVPASKIDLLPNSCDLRRFRPVARNTSLAKELGIPPQVAVIGYIGTFVGYEGLEDLARACGLLKRRGIEFRLLLVGNENTSGRDMGPIAASVVEVARAEGFVDWLIMPGRVPHEQVEQYYSLVDIAPFPRKPWPVCEMVSPMKPLEAFAMEKAVVASSVRALREMVAHEDTGLVFEKGKVEDLAAKLARLIEDPDLRSRLGRRAREWVAGERTWASTAERLAERLRKINQPEHLKS